MELQLPHPPTPEHAATLADLAVEAARATEDIQLDYSAASLEQVDALLARFHADGQGPDEVGTAVFLLACYTGEVLLRNLGGQWRTASESIAPALIAGDDHSLVVEFGNGYFDRPVARCFALLAGQRESSTYDFYTVASAAG